MAYHNDDERRLARQASVNKYLAKRRLDPEWRAGHAASQRKYSAQKRGDPDSRDVINAYQRAYYQANLEDRRAYQNARYAKNPAPARANANAYRAKKSQDPTWVEEKKRKERARYELVGRDQIRANRDLINARRKELRRGCPVSLADRMRVAVRSCLRGGEKRAPTFVALGYTVEQLARHLERQFTRGMSWENYGEWHIDHILPISSFKFSTTDDPEFKACWALANLRPLWAPENMAKHKTRVSLL